MGIGGGVGKKLGVEAATKLAERFPENMREQAVASLQDVAVDDVLADISGDAVRGALEALRPYLVELAEALDSRRIVIQTEKR